MRACCVQAGCYCVWDFSWTRSTYSFSSRERIHPTSMNLPVRLYRFVDKRTEVGCLLRPHNRADTPQSHRGRSHQNIGLKITRQQSDGFWSFDIGFLDSLSSPEKHQPPCSRVVEKPAHGGQKIAYEQGILKQSPRHSGGLSPHSSAGIQTLIPIPERFAHV
jgi:hypothetical protein